MSPDMKMTKLIRKNVVEEVYKQIYSNIQNAVFKEGDKLPTENELCKMLNVSRVSVRSAMQRLKEEGLILSKQGLGSFVTKPTEKIMADIKRHPMLISEKEYIDVVGFRKAIEFSAIDLIVEYAQKEDLEFVKTAMDCMCDCDNNSEKYAKADYNFHLGIMKASGNSVFVSVMEHIEDIFYRYLLSMANASVNGFEYGQSNHVKIYNALVNKNVIEAKRTIMKSMDYNLDCSVKKTNIFS